MRAPLRDILPDEAWEILNEFFQEFTAQLPAGLNRRTRYDFLTAHCAGLTDPRRSARWHHEPHGRLHVHDAGANLERADMTSRIVDVRSAQILPAAASDLGPFHTIQWISVLRSLSGQHMYRQTRRARVSRVESP